MSFHTERPKTTEEMISSLLEQRKSQETNRKVILENAKMAKLEKQNQAVLEATAIKTAHEDSIKDELERGRKARTRELCVRESTIGKMKMLEQAKQMTMNKVLFEMVYDAYWLDSDVKQRTVQETYNAYKDMIGVVESTCSGSKAKDSNKSKFIKAVETVVEEVCKKATDRILTEAKEKGTPNVEFNFTAEEEAELDQKLSDLGRDEIVAMVKDKVLTVVQDEKQSGKEKAEMLKNLENANSDDQPNDPEDSSVTESAMAIALSAAVVGTIIVATAISVKDKIDLKKALKVYEKNCNPSVTMSKIHPKIYELDKANRPTDKELSGIKKFFNKNSKRAKIWRTDDGKEVCCAILYTTTDYGVGASVSSDGVSPTLNITTTYHYLYSVNPEYKKDELYLTAMMAYSDGNSTKNTTALTLDMKKAFPEDMKNMKVKLIGKSLESVSAEEIMSSENSEGIDILSQDEYESNLMRFISNDFVDRDKVQKLLIECGADCSNVEASFLAAINQSDPNVSISSFTDYKNSLLKSRTKILIANPDEYSHEVKTAATSAINNEIKTCEDCIEKRKEDLNKPKPTVTLESMKMGAQRKAIIKSSGSTLFESMMMANAKSVREAIVTEGVSVKGDDAMNAALIETILQYTVLETLSTLKLYNFTSSDIDHLRQNNKASIRK